MNEDTLAAALKVMDDYIGGLNRGDEPAVNNACNFPHVRLAGGKVVKVDRVEWVTMADAQTAMTALTAEQAEVGFTSLQHDDQIGKLSLVGAGMRTNTGVSATFFKALAEAGINVEMISTSEIRISVVVGIDDVNAAVRAAHTAFGLDSGSGEAVIYGGTGR